jgi:hypothetical protein
MGSDKKQKSWCEIFAKNAKQKWNESRFASFRFEAKTNFRRNRRILDEGTVYT